MNKIFFKLFGALFLGGILMSCDTAPDLKTVELPIQTDPTVSMRVWFKVGSQDDPAGKEGLANLTAQLISEGATDSNSYEQILEKLYPMAAGYGAQVDKEMTVFFGRTHLDNLDGFAKLFQEALLQPAFTEADFNRLKSNLLNYLEKSLRYANDEEFGKAALSQMVFAGTPYAHPTAGYIESVKSLTLDDVKSFYQSHYTRGNVALGLAGGYPKEFSKRFSSTLAQLPAGKPMPIPKPVPAAIEGLEVLLIDKNTSSTAISLGFPINLVRSNSKDFYALWLANSWLGEHRNSASHLYQVIREARGMNYGDYSYIEHFPNAGGSRFPQPNVGRRQQIFQIWIRPVQNSARHFAVRAAVRELKHLVDNGLSPEDFELTRKFLKSYHLNYAPTSMMRLGYALDDVFYGLNPGFLASFDRMMDSLTLEDVNAAIKKYLQAENLKLVMITQDAAALQQALIADAVSPMVYESPKPASVLEEDKEIERFPLRVAPEKITVKRADEMFLR